MKPIILAAPLFLLGACSGEFGAKLGVIAQKVEARAEKAGQLYCAFSRAGGGTMIVAAADAAGVPWVVIDKSREAVARACRSIDPAAIPVAPPPAGTVVPTVAADIPS